MTFGATKKDNCTKRIPLGNSKPELYLKRTKGGEQNLHRDLASIQDPNIRAYVQAEQTRILKKRATQHQDQGTPHHLPI